MLRRRARVVPIALCVPAIVLCHAEAARAADAPPPCAACVVFAVSPGEQATLGRTAAPVAVELAAAALPDAASVRSDLVVVNARASSIADDPVRFALRTFATAFHAKATGARVGLELTPEQAGEPTLAAIAPYFDFVALPADAPIAPDRLPGIELWTIAGADVGSTAISAVSAPRLSGSDHLLVRMPPATPDIVRAVAALRDVLPAGLSPLADVSVSCDTRCDAAVYLDPQTLDAVAIVTPRDTVTAVTAAPAAMELTAFGAVQAHAAGPRLAFAATHDPFVLAIRGWRGITEGTFATGVEVSGTRRLRVEEVIARHQAARARQEAAVRTLISSGSTVLTLQVPSFPGPLTVTARTTVFSGNGQTDVEQEAIRVNGLDLQRRAGDAPRLPIVEPERVSTPPLTIALTEAYTYELRGRETANGRTAYVVGFRPRDPARALFAGRAWIDDRTFALVRTDAAQTNLRGAIASSREIDDYTVRDEHGTPVSLLDRAEIFQVYVGPTDSTPIHRVVTFDRHELNPPDYALRLDASYRSDAVMLRDTPQGYRFLVRDRTGSTTQPRQLAPSAVDHVATAFVGAMVDPNITIPLVFAGVSYVDFNLLKTGTQLNASFGGTYGRLSWSTRPLLAGRWRLSGDASGVAVSYNDRAFRGGVEHYEENVTQRPMQFSFAIVGPIARALRVRAAYDLGYTRYARADSTAGPFVVPSNTPVHGVRLAVEAERGAWNASGWVSAARRQDWRPWGLTPAPAQLDAQVFQRFGATVARSIVWSPRVVGHVEAAWMSGHRLDRFSRFAFGTFENPLRGYPAVSIRYDTGAAVRSVATWTPAPHLRLDGFADVGVVRPADERRVRAFPGVGAAIEAPAPFGWLVAAEWGYGVRGVNTNGSPGTHVIRVSGYKVF